MKQSQLFARLRQVAQLQGWNVPECSATIPRLKGSRMGFPKLSA